MDGFSSEWKGDDCAMRKICFFVALFIVLCCGLLCVFLNRSARPMIRVSKDFTYSRTQRSNAEYYNYENSIRPLQDSLLYWNGSSGASKTGFLDKVNSRMKAIVSTNGLHLTGAEISELCGNVRAILIDASDNRHPIPCRLEVYAENQQFAEVVASAFAQTMLQENELENRSMAWKSTMTKGLEVKRREAKVQALKKRLMTVGCDGEEKKLLESQILDAERSVVEADAEWQSAVAAYRLLWDAVIEFE